MKSVLHISAALHAEDFGPAQFTCLSMHSSAGEEAGGSFGRLTEPRYFPLCRTAMPTGLYSMCSAANKR